MKLNRILRALAGAILLWASSWPGLAESWVLTSAPLTNFVAVASSADGSNLVALVMGGPVYRSTNSGAAWTPAGAPATNWSAVASSADGIRLVAAVSGGQIYTSTNSGATWDETSAPRTNWAAVASSADGTKLVAGFSDVFVRGLIYTSTNSGGSWEQTSAPVGYWASLASSADGARLVAGSLFGKVYTSTNAGATWDLAFQPFFPDDFLCASTSADGAHIVTGGLRYGNHGLEPRALYHSADAGATWQVPVYSQAGDNWNSVSYSADGARFLALTSSGFIYASTNGGITCASNAWLGGGGFSVASSADGARAVAVAEVSGLVERGIYTFQTTRPPALEIAYSVDGLMISWLVPSAGFDLQQRSNLTTSSWTNVAATPKLNYTNLHYEVSIPAAAGGAFYRLKSQ